MTSYVLSILAFLAIVAPLGAVPLPTSFVKPPYVDGVSSAAAAIPEIPESTAVPLDTDLLYTPTPAEETRAIDITVATRSSSLDTLDHMLEMSMEPSAEAEMDPLYRMAEVTLEPSSEAEMSYYMRMAETSLEPSSEAELDPLFRMTEISMEPSAEAELDPTYRMAEISIEPSAEAEMDSLFRMVEATMEPSAEAELDPTYRMAETSIEPSAEAEMSSLSRMVEATIEPSAEAEIPFDESLLTLDRMSHSTPEPSEEAMAMSITARIIEPTSTPMYPDHLIAPSAEPTSLAEISRSTTSDIVEIDLHSALAKGKNLMTAPVAEILPPNFVPEGKVESHVHPKSSKEFIQELEQLNKHIKIQLETFRKHKLPIVKKAQAKKAFDFIDAAVNPEEFPRE